MLQISWTTRKSNEADTARSLINRIGKRQETFFGHVMRREKLKHLVTTGIIEENAAGENSVIQCWIEK